MKIVFLDLDGVLVTEMSLSRPMVCLLPSGQLREVLNTQDRWIYAIPDDSSERLYHQLDRGCVEQLNRLTEMSGANIVVSSSWRIGSDERFQQLVQYLGVCGIKGRILGRTPERGQTRGQEIARWLQDHPEVEACVILDDDQDMDDLMDHLIQTNFALGLQGDHVADAQEILIRGMVDIRHK